MKDRLTTLLGALLALLAVAVLLFPSANPEGSAASRPTTMDRGRYGLAGLQRWLSDAGVPVQSLRHRYTSLATDAELSETGNLLVLSLPQKLPAREKEVAELYDWLVKGNSVLVLSAVSDTPPWSLNSESDTTTDLISALGFHFDTPPSEDTPQRKPAVQRDAVGFTELIQSLKRQPRPLVPACRHALLDGVTTVEAHTFPRLEKDRRLESGGDRRLSLPLLWTHPEAAPAFWELRVGEGRAWVSRYPDLFGNVTLGLGDNAQLMVNLIRAALSAQGTVIFDDMHQGLSTLYDPSAFFGDARLHHTLWFVLGFWLLYVMGHSNRLAPLRKRRVPQRAVDLVRAMAGLFARRLPGHIVAGRLFTHFFNKIRTRHGLPTNGEPVWWVLEQSPRIDPAGLDSLKGLYEATAAQRKLDLVDLTNLLQKTRKELA